MPREPRVRAVVFDMDGVLVDTEHLWDEVREELTAEWGGRYTPEAQQAMMGMSSSEWSRYLHEVVGLREPPDVINGEVAGQGVCEQAEWEAMERAQPGGTFVVQSGIADERVAERLARASGEPVSRVWRGLAV